MFAIVIFFALPAWMFVVVFSFYLDQKPETKQKNSYRHTPKCANCHCDELNRGR